MYTKRGEQNDWTKGAAYAAHQQPQDAQLVSGQLGFFIAAAHLGLQHIQGQPFVGQHGAGFGRGSAGQQVLDTRQQYLRVEGLGDVVVRADAQTEQFVKIGSAARQHDDRQPGGLRGFTQLAAERKPVLARQVDIEQRQIGLCFGRLGRNPGKISRAQAGVAVFFKEAGESQPDRGVVLNDQNLHGVGGAPPSRL